MAKKFLNQKTNRFFFVEDGAEKSYVLIYGDEVDTLAGPASKGVDYRRVAYRGRQGQMRQPALMDERALEMYFLDVGQGDAAFMVTPNGTNVLVDGGLKDRALGFLVWKYRLDDPNATVTIDHLILSHADRDHVEGLVPLLGHPRIAVRHIWHNGIAVFTGGFNEELGDVTDGVLTTLHSGTADLEGLALSSGFREWIDAATASGATYAAIDESAGVLDIGDPAIRIEILGPRRASGGGLPWFDDKSHTINGHSVVFRVVYGHVRAFFSGDLNIEGSRYLLEPAGAALRFNAHIMKSPHHGSHEFLMPMFRAINPMVSVTSSGDEPDHGHPRASFLGGLGVVGRGPEPLVFSTEIAATFVDAGDAAAVAMAAVHEPTTLGDLDFAKSKDNETARRRFKKVLPGIINVRTDGNSIYAARRVSAAYQWESYGPLEPLD